jgi:uncharacterized protein (DUF58 family)
MRFTDWLNRTSFYLGRKVIYGGFAVSILFFLSYFIPAFFQIAIACLVFLLVLIGIDSLLLYSRRGMTAHREVPTRFSNGDRNKVVLHLSNRYGFKAFCIIIDELPFQMQERKWNRVTTLEADERAAITYYLDIKERGEFLFGAINIYMQSPMRLVIRRYRFPEEQLVKVYPSYLQMRRYQFMATASHQEVGVKRVRRLGHSLEFEQIKDYVPGDDYRTINWKATARKGDLMTNNYTDERSQQIYCIINKGRVMKMPFEGMSLLDYSINAALVLSNIALSKQDKAGLITFAQRVDSFLTADKKPMQLNAILETLYNQETGFQEPDFEHLFSVIRNRITNRSLLVLFTNFESMESLERELPFLKRMAHYHLLMVVFFENTELKQLLEQKAENTEAIYIKTIAEKYQLEKRLIVKELQKHGIIALLTSPAKLTINSINKYLELKNRQSI